MVPVQDLGTANQKVIKSLKKDLSTGHDRNPELTGGIEAAIRFGKIKLTRIEDDCSYSELAGDIFTPEVHDSIDPAQLKREEKAFKARIRNSGQWLYQSWYWGGRSWNRSDSIGGFVGWDFMGSGYELQVMDEALTEYNQQPLDAAGFVIDPYRNAA